MTSRRGDLPFLLVTYVALLVQGCCTVGARVLHSWYQIAGLLVPDSCTFLVLLFEILYMTGQMGFKTDFSFDSVCILNDSFRGGLVFNLIYANVFFDH